MGAKNNALVLNMEADTLSAILRSHHVGVDQDSLQSALGDAERPSEFSQWAKDHLTPDTLLSVDEHDL